MFNLSKEKKYIKISLIVIIVSLLVIDLFVIFKFGNYFIMGNMDSMNNDDVHYIRTAKVLLEKGILVDKEIDKPTVAEMPGHAFVLAGFFAIFGANTGLYAFRVFQAVLQILSLLLIFFITRELFDSKVALIACVIDAIYIPEISNVGLILMDITFKFLLLLLTYISLYGIKKKESKYYVIGGVVWGVACLFRPTISLYPAIILVMWIIYKFTFKEILKYTIITTLVFSAVMSPWWIRNYLTFQKFIPLSSASGNPFLQGTYINYDQSQDPPSYYPGKDAAETDKIEMELGIKRLKENFKKYPLQYIHWYTIGKTKFLWQYPFYWKNIFGISFITVERIHIFIIHSGILGLIIFAYKKRRNWLVPLLIAYFTVTHLPYYTFSRYAFPAMPCFVIYSAYCVRILLSKEVLNFFRVVISKSTMPLRKI